MSNIEKRPSDLMWDKYNRIYDSKLTDSLQKNELAEELILIGDLGANDIKQGKMPNEEIENFSITFPKDNIFKLEHKDIPRSYKTAQESIDIAKEYSVQRSMNIPVDSKSKGLRRTA